MDSAYKSIDVELDDQVATVSLLPQEDTMESDELVDLHWDLGDAFSHLRGNNDVRVVVLQSAAIDHFYYPPAGDVMESDLGESFLVDPVGAWHTWTGILRLHAEMAELEKPIVAKVHGDAASFGQSLVLACDLIVAAEDAVIVDSHMDNSSDLPGSRISVVPGDGGGALAPLYFSPPLAKEYLMLSRAFTAAELAEFGLINYAVPSSELDEKVDELVDGLLSRSAYALAWTKRIANRHVVHQLNQTLDASAAYEMVTFLQHALTQRDPDRLA